MQAISSFLAKNEAAARSHKTLHPGNAQQLHARPTSGQLGMGAAHICAYGNDVGIHELNVGISQKCD
jgi:hypothetical protein